MHELSPKPVAIDATQLWKWVQYYLHSARQSARQVQQVMAALKQSYWQGIISWDQLFSCEQMLGPLLDNVSTGQGSATALSLALSQIGHTILGEYYITGIAGFIDQGILFTAQKNHKQVTLLCLTTDAVATDEIINRIPDGNQCSLAHVLIVDKILYTEKHVYLLFSVELGQPLCAWLIAQYPLGLPKNLATLLLNQIYQLLLTLRTHNDMITSYHPGQWFIDPECLALQWIPCVSSTYYATQTDTRARAYQAPRLFANNSETALAYRFMAMAYELYTGCMLGKAQKAVLDVCKELTPRQKQLLEHGLSLQNTLSLTEVAAVLGIHKKKYAFKRSYIYLAVASVLVFCAWQGNLWLIQGQEIVRVADAVEIQQDSADQHINLLKAAFFKHVQENNIHGASVSWQALQQLLPEDDIFIEKIGPELIAKVQFNSPMNRNQKSVQIPEPDMPLAEQSAESVSLAAATLEALPPLPQIILPELVLPPEIVSPAQAPQTASIEQQLEAIVLTDPCQYALTAQQEKRVACMDALSETKFGPGLVAAQINAEQSMAITKQAISIADYNQYCIMTKRCKPYQSDSAAQATGLDLGLSDIESVVSDYNAYCVVSGSCDPLGPAAEPVQNLTPKQIQTYAAWLSQETGFTYRLPTAAEWKEMNLSNKTTVEWVLDSAGKWITTAGIDPHHPHKSRSIDKNQIAFRLVREIKS